MTFKFGKSNIHCNDVQVKTLTKLLVAQQTHHYFCCTLTVLKNIIIGERGRTANYLGNCLSHIQTFGKMAKMVGKMAMMPHE